MRTLLALAALALAPAPAAADPLDPFRRPPFSVAADSPLFAAVRPHMTDAVVHRSSDGRAGYLEVTVRMDGAEAALRYYPAIRGGGADQQELTTLRRPGQPPVPMIHDGTSLVLLLPGAMQKRIAIAASPSGPSATLGADVAVPLMTLQQMDGRLRSAAAALPGLPAAGPAPGQPGWTPPDSLEMIGSTGRRGYRLEGNTLYYVAGDGRRTEVGYLSSLPVRGTRGSFSAVAVNAPGGGQVAYTLGGVRIGAWEDIRRASTDIWFRPVEGGRSVPLLPLAYNRHGSATEAIDAEGQRYELRFRGRTGFYAPVGPAGAAAPVEDAMAPAAAPSGPASISLAGGGGFRLEGDTLSDGSGTQVGRVVSINVGGGFGRRRAILYQPAGVPREQWGYYAHGTGGELQRLGGVGELGTGNVWSRPVVDAYGRPAGSRVLIPILGTNRDARGNWASIERRYVDLNGDHYTLDLSGRVGVFRPAPRPEPPAIPVPRPDPPADPLPTPREDPPVPPPMSSTGSQPPEIEADQEVRSRVDAALAALLAAHRAPTSERAERVRAAMAAIRALGAGDKPYLSAALGRLLHASAQPGYDRPLDFALDLAELYSEVPWDVSMPEPLMAYRQQSARHIVALFARLPRPGNSDDAGEDKFDRLARSLGRLRMPSLPAIAERRRALERLPLFNEDYWLLIAHARALEGWDGRGNEKREVAEALVRQIERMPSVADYVNHHRKQLAAFAAIAGMRPESPAVVTFLNGVLARSSGLRWAIAEQRRAAIATLQRLGVANDVIARAAVPQLLLDASAAGADGNTDPEGRRSAINHLDSLPVVDEPDRERRIAALRAIKDGDPVPGVRRAAEDAMNALIRGRPAPR